LHDIASATGIVATHTDRELPRTTSDNSDEAEVEEVEPAEPVKVLEKQATFGDFVVWAHETIPAADDPYVKGVEEWIKFAEAVCFLFSGLKLIDYGAALG
jgi:ribonuclease H2 subunit C